MNPFKLMDFAFNEITGRVHVITGLPSNEREKSVFDLSDLVEIDGLKGSQPHHANFRHATKEEVLRWVESKF